MDGNETTTVSCVNIAETVAAYGDSRHDSYSAFVVALNDELRQMFARETEKRGLEPSPHPYLVLRWGDELYFEGTSREIVWHADFIEHPDSFSNDLAETDGFLDCDSDSIDYSRGAFIDAMPDASAWQIEILLAVEQKARRLRLHLNTLSWLMVMLHQIQEDEAAGYISSEHPESTVA